MKRTFFCEDADLSKVSYPIMGFPKIDGVRMLHLIGSATSRSLLPHQNKYTTNKFSAPIYEGLDGEATVGDIRSEELCRNTTSALNTIEGEPDVKWNVFDFIRDDKIHLPYIERYEALNIYIKAHKPDNVSIIDFVWLHNEEEVIAYYKKCLKDGFEGIILRDPNALYKHGRATQIEASYLRLKPSSDKDAIVIDLIEAQTNLNEKKKNALGLTERSSHKENKIGKGMIGTLICKDLKTGQIINIGPGKMKHEERVYYWNHQDEIINQPIKYRSMDKGIKDAPRFGRFICFRSKEDIVEV